ncbi:MAG: arsenic resistance N-acetyltransferase ArsN2 [Gemmatimonadota bacterium]
MGRPETATIRQAAAGDHRGLLSLLTEAGLPVEGVPESLEGFLVAETADGTIVGAAGIETHGHQGLLRSVVVSPALRGTGLGQALTEHALARARNSGLIDLYLLTTTAERFFPRFGFEPISRDRIRGAVLASAEFQGACPSTAVIMHCTLAP